MAAEPEDPLAPLHRQAADLQRQMGLRVDAHAAVHWGGLPSPNLFAAGEVMVGNVLGQGYTAGVGMTIGTVFGRIAGREAARAAA